MHPDRVEARRDLAADRGVPGGDRLGVERASDPVEHHYLLERVRLPDKVDYPHLVERPSPFIHEGDLFAALVATLPPREERDLAAPLFPDLTDARLRTAISKACKAIGIPHFSPHGLRRRRGSLHYKRTGSLAMVAELLGDLKRVAADHYVYALTDYREVDRTVARSPARNSPDSTTLARRVLGGCWVRAAEYADLQGWFDSCRAHQAACIHAGTA